MIKVTMTGRLTRDAEQFQPQDNGNPYIRFSLASNFAFGKYAEELEKKGQPTALFVDCISFGQRFAWALPYLGKGAGVVISGSLSQKTWEGNDGQKRTGLNVNVDDLEVTHSKDNAAVGSSSGGNPWDN